ncbi:glycoside hydrolase family 105 protein [Paenibacillus sp. S150]|uniref:glycoside hydrolase family 88/105 protein n=1 Tax=Paenibacillus sp. S150 TaxID=2749826 RepID=UPI001C56ED3A|nr:glycoside hydrolase family 88 protein [Paenibacillus sp. S150]MBW4082639.1 glycoside hydrolase family 88 protein [Paenibacillus sp. S150]
MLRDTEAAQGSGTRQPQAGSGTEENGAAGRAEAVIRRIAHKYIADHPQIPFVLRASSGGGFLRDGECRYIFDLDARLPGLRTGQFVYAWAKLFSRAGEEMTFSISCLGPVRLYLNGKLAYKSGIDVEVFPERQTLLVLLLQPEWNHFVLEFEKTGTGCGGRFGTGMLKRNPLHFLAPSRERSGQEGWIYTLPLDEPLEKLPGEHSAEAASPLDWLPGQEWLDLQGGLPGKTADEICGNISDEAADDVSGGKPSDTPAQKSMSAHSVHLGDIYGAAAPGAIAYSWTRLHSRNQDSADPVTVSGTYSGELRITLEGKLLFQSAACSGTFRFSLPRGTGEGELLVRSVCPPDSWQFSLELPADRTRLSLPAEVQGADRQEWLHLGPFAPQEDVDADTLCRMDQLYTAQGQGAYWQLGRGTVIRPYVETENYGRWNYPLGVTLLGLLRTGRLLEEEAFSGYARQHIAQCAAYDRYALWDQERYGASGVNHQLARIDSLDDCGAFAATLLAAMELGEIRGGAEAADRIAGYIMNEQERLPEGTFYRGVKSMGIKHRTLWCDDLYMCVPFLTGYFKRTGEHRYLDEACAQLLAYKRFLYLPEKRFMSHVYDFKFNKPTEIPWGRGNGWAYFALARLLEELPDIHPDRQSLLLWFREFSEGIAGLQGAGGLWHQLLDDPSSYEETSCTSMFVYGLSKGMRLGWLADPQGMYADAVRKGWTGLSTLSTDQQGNVHGVCRGSGYSFSRRYYKHDLPWKLNDTHGIGIILLAGVEFAAWSRNCAPQKSAIAENNGIRYSE